jgi:hypothetical protein
MPTRATTGCADALELMSIVARSARMPHVQYWARVRAGQDCPLRRGAWYRVVDLTPVEAIVDVNNRLLHIPRAFVQVLPLRPPAWTVVPGPDAGRATAGRKYGVCPSCCARARLEGSAPTMRCPKCGTLSAVAWSDADWRAFEVRTGRPAPGTLAKARARALKALAAAFGLRG